MGCCKWWWQQVNRLIHQESVLKAQALLQAFLQQNASPQFTTLEVLKCSHKLVKCAAQPKDADLFECWLRPESLNRHSSLKLIQLFQMLVLV